MNEIEAEDDFHKYFESFRQNYFVSIRSLHNPPTNDNSLGWPHKNFFCKCLVVEIKKVKKEK